MFDFAWSEIALIGIVALVAIGPKDLPVAIKAVAAAVKKARRMASEFQVHVDEMVREADLHEVREGINQIRRMDIKGKILSAMDEDGTLRKTMTENPLHTAQPTTPMPMPLAETAVPPLPEHTIAAPDPMPLEDAVPVPPASAPHAAAPVAAAPHAADGEPAEPLAAAHPAPAAPAPAPQADAKQPPLHA